jgi:adenylate cyclase
MGVDELGTLKTLKEIRREIVDPAIASHNGRIVKTTGDGLLVEFSSAVEAVTCAMAVQDATAGRNSHAPLEIAFRIGINVGDIIVDGDDIFGDGVNIAARVENECEPGCVFLSGSAFEQVRGKTPFSFDDLGEKSLKNIDRLVRIYAVRQLAMRLPLALSPAAGSPSPADKPSIAVLPFANMSGDPEQEYFADGITEDIITALSKWRWFQVVARNSSFTYKGRNVDARQIGRELGVRYVLEGSVRKSTGRVRVTAQLIDAANGAHLWAERYDRELVDMFAIQDDLSQHVGAAIEPALSRSETDRARRKTPEQMVAYDHLMRGIWHFHRFNTEDARKAVVCFEQAIALDGTLADAYANLARTLLSGVMYGFSPAPGSNSEAAEVAAKAIALDPANPIACYVTALVLAHRDDPETAAAFARRALELNDSYTPAYFALAVASTFLGHLDDALAAIDRAAKLSPADPQHFVWLAQRASALYLSKRYGEAVDAARQSLRLRWYHTGCRVLAASLAQIGDIEQAKSAMRELFEHPHGDRTIQAVIRPFARQIDRDQYAEGLRKAGMPE